MRSSRSFGQSSSFCGGSSSSSFIRRSISSWLISSLGMAAGVPSLPVPDPSTFALFAAASVAFLAIPGPAVLYIVTRSVVHGRRLGVLSALGVQAGGLVSVVRAAAGGPAALPSPAPALPAVEYPGAAAPVLPRVRQLPAPPHPL